MEYDPKWDERLYEIRRMPTVMIKVGGDYVLSHFDGQAQFFVLKEDWTAQMETIITKLNPMAAYVVLERLDDQPSSPN